MLIAQMQNLRVAADIQAEETVKRNPGLQPVTVAADATVRPERRNRIHSRRIHKQIPRMSLPDPGR